MVLYQNTYAFLNPSPKSDAKMVPNVASFHRFIKRFKNNKTKKNSKKIHLERPKIYVKN